MCFSANTGRAQRVTRLAVVARTTSELASLLGGFAETGALPRDASDARLAAVAAAFLAGKAVDTSALRAPGARRVRLPTYPFQRQRCWFEKASEEGDA